MARASCRLMPIGFSTSTCLPAAAALRVPLHVLRMRRRNVDGLDARVGQQRSYEPCRRGTPNSAPKASALSAVRDPTAASSPVCECFTPNAKALAMAPVARSPQRILSAMVHTPLWFVSQRRRMLAQRRPRRKWIRKAYAGIRGMLEFTHASDHSPCGHGRVLCVDRTARSSRIPRPAGGCGGRTERAGRGGGRLLRGPPVRHSFRHAVARSRTTLPPRRVRAPDMPRYVEASRQIAAIWRAFTPFVEPLSLDEAFLDVSGAAGLFGRRRGIARLIKTAIRAETPVDRLGRRGAQHVFSPSWPATSTSLTG